jgi:hypothetical protein
MNENARANMLPLSSQMKSTVFVLDNDSNRKRRADRITALKELGLKIYPGRKLEGALGRCLANNFDLIVVNGGSAATRAISICEELLAAKPNQKVLLLYDESSPVVRSYSTLDDLDQLRCHAQRLLAGEMGKNLPVAA